MNPPIVNAQPITVAYRNGQSETLNLGELSIRNLYRWIEHLSARDTPALVALCVGKPVDWIDTLTDESYGELSRLAFELNFPRATALSGKDVTVASLMKPILLEIARLAPDSDGAPSSDKSPEPAASASAAATGSESST